MGAGAGEWRSVSYHRYYQSPKPPGQRKLLYLVDDLACKLKSNMPSKKDKLALVSRLCLFPLF